MSKYLPILFLLLFTVAIYNPFIFWGRLPVAADTIVGLYHPWRDFYADKHPNGIPFKNYLITDPVRQQYVWRELAVEQLKLGMLPYWNPYSLAGTPLLANIQTAALYPINILYWFLPFAVAWSWQVILQTLLGGIFMWLYLRNLRLRPESQALGVLSWIGSGFFVAWLEWNTVVQVAIWLPLSLWAIDKIFEEFRHTRRRLAWLSVWGAVLIFSLSASFLAGHLQVFFYIWLLAALYIIARAGQSKRYLVLFLFVICHLLFVIFTFPQWYPTLTLFSRSVRSIDPNSWTRPGWFLPWQNLSQFVAPDFFGNPATLNYFGVWNYGEFVGYVGVSGLIFALFGFIFRRDRKVLFFGTILLAAIFLSTSNFISQLPYRVQIPFISSAQPTRLMVIIDFCLVILSCLGFDYFLRINEERRKIFVTVIMVGIVLGLLWAVASAGHLSVSLHNLILPTILFSLTAMVFLAWGRWSEKIQMLAVLTLLTLTVFDLFRFASKFESFSDQKYLFPETEATRFLEEKVQNSPPFRIATVDDRVMPPNFSDHYHIQSIDGYDSLFLKNYAGLFSKKGSAFNRILTPKDYESNLFDFLNVRYVLSLNRLDFARYHLVFEEGGTKVYENLKAYPRAFFEDGAGDGVQMGRYSPEEIIIKTSRVQDGRLVLTDNYYHFWKASIDNRPAKIYLTYGVFRSVIVPAGNHTVRFYY